MSGPAVRTDAVVVGAGTAGANVACELARLGMGVVLVERRAASHGGAHWHNGVLDWQFRRAGLGTPVPPERVRDGATVHLFGPDGRRAVTVADSPVVTADMALLGERLRSSAGEQGVEVLDRVAHLSVEVRGGRVTALELAGGRRLEAALFVDASGRRGVLRSADALLRPWCPPVRGDELCTATDVVLRVADTDGARRYLDRFGVPAGDTISMVGTHGGFSTCGVTVSAALDEVSVLVGCLANGRYGTGPRMLGELRRREPWIGEEISGGSGVIPLRRPYARFTAPGLAMVGDAACQVFPAHGSGIGIGLIAGRMLADAVRGAADPGAETTLWAYQAAFQRELGGLLAAFDGFRRMSTALGGDGVGRMLSAGLMTEPMVRAGLDQRWRTPTTAELPAMAARLAREPGLAARMLPMLVRGQLAGRAGARYPEEVDGAALAAWDARVARLLGPLPR
jgi:flavin-dependent dehydrogenase